MAEVARRHRRAAENFILSILLLLFPLGLGRRFVSIVYIFQRRILERIEMSMRTPRTSAIFCGGVRSTYVDTTTTNRKIREQHETRFV